MCEKVQPIVPIIQPHTNSEIAHAGCSGCAARPGGRIVCLS